MARVVEAAGPDHRVVVVHVGPEGGFDLAGALHPEVLPLAQAHGLPVIGSLLFSSYLVLATRCSEWRSCLLTHVMARVCGHLTHSGEPAQSGRGRH
jgi:hypothetical protein